MMFEDDFFAPTALDSNMGMGLGMDADADSDYARGLFRDLDDAVPMSPRAALTVSDDCWERRSSCDYSAPLQPLPPPFSAPSSAQAPPQQQPQSAETATLSSS